MRSATTTRVLQSTSPGWGMARLRVAGLAVAVTAMALAAPAQAQYRSQPGIRSGSRIVQQRVRIPQRETAIRLARRVTVDFDDQRLEDVMDFVIDLTQADIDVKYIDERNSDGLDPDQTISLKADNVTSLQLIEMILDRAETEFSTSGNSWQFTRLGTLEVGPKERLNKRRRVEIYSIADMLVDIPRYDNAPTFDLNAILQSNRGGGGQSPFSDTGGDDVDRISRDEKAEEIVSILQELIEPEQWIDNGGESASLRYWQGNLIINAPDYVHRQINGYPWWPAQRMTVTQVRGRRWVSLNLDTSFAEIDGFASEPVSAVVNGRIIRSDRPGGGG